MKRALLIGIIFSIAAMTPVMAYISAIAIQAENAPMQVYVNGKLYNQHPGKFVRIKSMPGLFHVEVKVLNPHDKRWYLIKQDISVDKGFETHYKVVFAKGLRPWIKQVKRFPVYSRYFLNPSLYNRHPIS